MSVKITLGEKVNYLKGNFFFVFLVKTVEESLLSCSLCSVYVFKNMFFQYLSC